MNKSRLKKRAELRRKMAYYQGGAEGAEPNDFKKIEEDAKKYWDEDKQMKQTDANFNDVPEKEKLSRADLQERAMKRMAYYQGGSEGVEPKTYKDEGQEIEYGYRGYHNMLNYNHESFEQVFSNYFEIMEKVNVIDTERTLYLMVKKYI